MRSWLQRSLKVASLNWRVPAAAATLLGATAVSGCASAPPGSVMLRVALQVEKTLTGAPARYMLEGETFAVVRLDGAAPVTLAAAAAPEIVSAFRDTLDPQVLPASSSAVGLSLPGAVRPELENTPLEILFFRDVDGNGQWNPPEPRVQSWTGGRDTYRVLYRGLTGSTGGQSAGWVLIEGGVPETEHRDFGDRVVFIRPVIEPVESER